MKSTRLLLLFVLVLLLLGSLRSSFWSIDAKFVKTNARLPPSGSSKTLTTFSFLPGGTGTARFKFTYPTKTKKATLFMFMDTKWDSLKSRPVNKCSELEADASAYIVFGDKIVQGLGVVALSEVKDVDGGQKEWQFEWRISHFVRTYGWYFVLADCGNENQEAFTGSTRVNYEITIVNDGEDHMPADEYGLPTFYFVALVILCAYAGFVAKTLIAANSNPETQEEAPVAVAAIVLAYSSQIISVLFEMVHLWYYSYNGYGSTFLDFFSEVFEGFSQTMISFILLSFANGWGISQTSLASVRNRGDSEGSNELIMDPDALGIDDPAAYILGIVFVFSIVLHILNKLAFADPFTKFHDHETIPGKILVAIRTIIAFVFVVTMSRSIKFHKKTSGKQLIRFLQLLLVLGSAWFFSLPISIFIAESSAHYVRHRIVTVCVVFSQTLCLILLSHQLLTTASAYKKARFGSNVFSF